MTFQGEGPPSTKEGKDKARCVQLGGISRGIHHTATCVDQATWGHSPCTHDTTIRSPQRPVANPLLSTLEPKWLRLYTYKVI